MKNILLISILSLSMLSSEEIALLPTLGVPVAKKIQSLKDVSNPPLLAKITLSSEDKTHIDLEIPGNIDELRSRLNAHFGKPLTMENIHAIKRDVIAFYQQNNYPFVAVHVSEQDITDGHLELIVQQSKLGKVTVSGNRYFSSDRYRNGIRISEGEQINEKRLLNNIDFLNRNPFRRVNLVYAEGASKNTTDVDLIVEDRFPLTGYAGVDNTGLQHINRTRIFGGFTWGNVFGCDQILAVQYTMAPNIHKFFAITGSYIIPLPIQHIVNLYGGYSQVHAHVPSSSKTSGFSSQASLRYTIPLPASSSFLEDCFAGFDFKRYNNTVEFVELSPVFGQTVDLTQFIGGYNFSFERGRHKLGFDVQLVFSPFQWLPDQSNADFESLNPFARHTYVYGQASINYKVRLPGEWYWTFFTTGQLANQTLLPSEQFGIGGYSTVRGYEERQLNADDGFLVKTEFFSPKINFAVNAKDKRVVRTLEFLAFLDYGFAHDRHRYGEEKRNEYLLGAGPGLRFSIGHNFLARLDWGFKLHQANFPGGWSMAHFSVTGSY